MDIFGEHKMRRTFLLFLSLTIALTTAGCNSCNKRISEIKSIKAILIPFKDAENKPGSGRSFSVGFKSSLAEVSEKEKIPYIFVTTLELNEAIDKLKIQKSDWDDHDKRYEIAKAVKADVIITGQVTIWDQGDLFKYGTIAFKSDCVNVDTGATRWDLAHKQKTGAMSVDKRTPEYSVKEVAQKGIKTISKKL